MTQDNKVPESTAPESKQAEPEKGAQEKVETKPEPEKKKGWSWLSWERDVEILKIAVTFYAACIGTFVTFQFNERQHELNRIEAIAKMLPHLSEADKADADSDARAAESQTAESATPAAAALTAESKKHAHASHRLTRDGAIWAIFRTANNKTMLRDLAALFPADIYRVVSSIAASGGLNNDEEALTALQVASEKLANKYSMTNTVVAARLYHQAVKLKERKKNSNESFPIVDLTDEMIDDPPTDDHITEMLNSLNKLGELHKNESETSDKVSTGRWNAKQMYKRVRALGKKATSKKAKAEVIIADIALANLYLKEHRPDAARVYLQEALPLNIEVYGPDHKSTAELKARLQEMEGVSKASEAAPQ
jgi:hypothetical protein